MLRAYTLLEVLIGFVVILLLAALLTLGLISSKKQSSATACLVTERQLASAISLYLQDYDQVLPIIAQQDSPRSPTPTWLLALQSYTKSRLVCPTLQVPANLQQRWADGFTTGYALNNHLNDYQGGKHIGKYTGLHEAALSGTSLTVMLLEARAGIVAATMPDTNASDQSVVTYCFDCLNEIFAQTEGGKRHEGGANYTFLDGHAKWFKPEQLKTEARCDGVHPGFGL